MLLTHFAQMVLIYKSPLCVTDTSSDEYSLSLALCPLNLCIMLRMPIGLENGSCLQHS